MASLFENDFRPSKISSRFDEGGHTGLEDQESYEYDASLLESDLKWEEKSLRTRGELNMPSGFNPWSGHPCFTNVSTLGLTAREADCINVGYFKWCLLQSQEEACLRSEGKVPAARTRWPAWWVDITQDVSRISAGPTPPSIHTHSCLYSYQHNRTYKGEDMPYIHAYIHTYIHT